MKVIIDPRNELEVYDLEGNLLFQYKGTSLTLKIDDLDVDNLDGLDLAAGEVEQIKQILEKRKREFY